MLVIVLRRLVDLLVVTVALPSAGAFESRRETTGEVGRVNEVMRSAAFLKLDPGVELPLALLTASAVDAPTSVDSRGISGTNPILNGDFDLAISVDRSSASA